MKDEPGHYDADEFRAQGHRMIDWIADYLDGGARTMPVLSRVRPGDVSDLLPDAIPEHPEDLDAVLMMLCANESQFVNGAVISADDGQAI